jgi:hypothetical protein
MSRLALAALVASLAVLPAVPLAEPARAEGRIESDGARVEILGKPYRVGETIQLPEGYLRVEEAGPEDEEVGSFTVVPSSALSSVSAASSGELRSAADPAARSAAPVRACRAEKAALVAEIWKASGIEVDDPEALLAAFEGSPGNPNVASLWLALSTDAFRPLAWSSDARSKAAALSRCMRAN